MKPAVSMMNWAAWLLSWGCSKESIMKKKRTNGVMAATTTSRDWGHGPVAGKGGKTQNSWIGDGMIHRELKDQKRN